MREYKMAKEYAILIYVASPFLIALFGWLLLLPFNYFLNHNSIFIAWLFILLYLGIISFVIVVLINIAKAKFVIDVDRIYWIDAFSTKELMFNEIKGYTISDKYILIEPNVETKNKITISTSFGKLNEVKDWLYENYQDLGAINKEQEEILYDETSGFTQEEREQKLKPALRVAMFLNVAGVAIAIWTWFGEKPYEYALIACIATPIISISVSKFYRGIYPSILWAFFASSATLFSRSFFDLNIFNYSHVWLPVIGVTLLFLAFMLIGNQEFNLGSAKRYGTAPAVFIFILSYAFGTVSIVNCFYDKSEPELYKTKVLSKHIAYGKTTDYYLKLAPWGPRKEVANVFVSENFYKEMQIDEDATIYFHKGLFNIPWYEVAKP